jgi:Ca-activated chloride channel family protein
MSRRSDSRRRSRFVALGFALALVATDSPVAASAPAEPAEPAGRFAVRFLAPAAGASLFGEIAVAVEVNGGAAASLRIELDGSPVARLTAPPWKATVDVGQENEPRKLRAIATSPGGDSAEATLVLAALQVDEEIDLPLRQVYVTAERAEARGRRLGREDFRILDDGVRQELVTFERGDVPLTAALLVDSSLSMEGEPLRAALAGARAFVERLAKLDEAMLLLFSDRIAISRAFGDRPDDLVAAALAATAGGGSAIHDHLYLALELLERRQGRRVAILLSDGIDIDSFLGADQVAEMAARSQATIYWIRVASEPFETRYRSPWREPEEHAAHVAALDELVRASGGRRIDIPDAATATAAFEEIVAELRGQYVLGYYPSRAAGDGAWHELAVSTKAPGVRLRARDGYFDD